MGTACAVDVKNEELLDRIESSAGFIGQKGIGVCLGSGEEQRDQNDSILNDQVDSFIEGDQADENEAEDEAIQASELEDVANFVISISD